MHGFQTLVVISHIQSLERRGFTRTMAGIPESREPDAIS